MQRLTLAIEVGDKVPGDAFGVCGNVDSVGRVTESIDSDNPITGDSPQAFYPLEARRYEWGEGAWGQGPWGGKPAIAGDLEVVTPPLYFGDYLFEVVPYDEAGNAAVGDPADFAVTVNSGPEPVTRFRQTGVDDGLPVFAFTPPAQFVS